MCKDQKPSTISGRGLLVLEVPGDLNVWKIVSFQTFIHLVCLIGAKSIKKALLSPITSATLHCGYALLLYTI